MTISIQGLLRSRDSTPELQQQLKMLLEAVGINNLGALVGSMGSHHASSVETELTDPHRNDVPTDDESDRNAVAEDESTASNLVGISTTSMTS